jgi:hypothetical protein
MYEGSTRIAKAPGIQLLASGLSLLRATSSLASLNHALFLPMVPVLARSN